MQVKVDDDVLYTISSEDILLLKDEIPSEILISDVKRRAAWVIEHKLSERWKEFRDQWTPVLYADPTVQSIPANKKDFVNLVVSRSDYKDRDARDAIALARR